MTVDPTRASTTVRALVGTFSAAVLAVVATTSVAASTAGASGSSGDLDPTFGHGGTTRVDLGGIDHAVAGFRLPDGRYLVVGESIATSGKVRIGATRLSPDGHLDRGFGNNGRALVSPLALGHVDAAALTPTGRIVVLGRDRAGRLALVRLRSSGRLDTSFGTRGVVHGSDADSSVGVLLVQPDGRIVMGVRQLSRYLRDGAVDDSFGHGGQVPLNQYSAAALLRQDDGDLIVFGPTGASLAGRRLHADGSRDLGFGRRVDSNAFVRFYPRYMLSGTPIDAAFGPNGRIMLASLVGNETRSVTQVDGLVVAFTPGGKPATGFHQKGWRALDFGGLEWFTSIATLGDGRVLVAGNRTPAVGAPTDAVVLAMLDVDGELDVTFGDAGKVVTPMQGRLASPQVADLLLEGSRAVVFGAAGDDFMVSSYLVGPA